MPGAWVCETLTRPLGGDAVAVFFRNVEQHARADTRELVSAVVNDQRFEDASWYLLAPLLETANRELASPIIPRIEIVSFQLAMTQVPVALHPRLYWISHALEHAGPHREIEAGRAFARTLAADRDGRRLWPDLACAITWNARDPRAGGADTQVSRPLSRL